jgi:hypothetical protein
MGNVQKHNNCMPDLVYLNGIHTILCTLTIIHFISATHNLLPLKDDRIPRNYIYSL